METGVGLFLCIFSLELQNSVEPEYKSWGREALLLLVLWVWSHDLDPWFLEPSYISYFSSKSSNFEPFTYLLTYTTALLFGIYIV